MDNSAGFPRFAEQDLPIALMLVVFAIVACTIPAQSDTFYHLLSGQRMWDSGSLITTEQFSWTYFGKTIVNHWWLSQLVFHGLYSMGGPVLLTAVAGFIAFSSVLMSWRLAGGSARMQFAVLVGLVLTVPEWAVRPQVFSLLFTALILRLIAYDQLILLAPVIVLWANMHAVVVLGTALAFVPLMDAVLWDRSRILRGVVVAASAVAASMVTPFGIRYWTSMTSTVEGSRALGLQEYRTALNLEPTTLAFWAVAGALAIATFHRGRDLRALDRSSRLLILSAFVLLAPAVTAIRNIPFFVLAALPALSRLVDWTKTAADARRTASVAARSLLASAIVVGVVIIGVRWKEGGRDLGWSPVPATVISAIQSCPGPMYNGFDEGGYLMWFVPGRQVFVDGRVEAYPLDFLLQARHVDLAGDYHALFARYGIKCAVVRTRPMYDAIRRDPALQLAVRQDGWAVFSPATDAARQ
jgi:hypothetical protein